jgi:hypothetical protein
VCAVTLAQTCQREIRRAPQRGERGREDGDQDGASDAYGVLQLSDKSDGADFTAEDEDRIRDLAAFSGATLDALRAARR